MNTVTAAPLDLTVSVTTPENISFEYNLAGPFRRVPAFLLDLLFRLLFFFGIGYALLLVGLTAAIPSSNALFYASMTLLYFFLSWSYGVIFETIWNGQTPGKRMVGLRVMSADGRPINPAQAMIRNLVRVADMFPYASLQIFGPELPEAFVFPTFLVSLSCMSLTKRFQRLGDLAAGTMVIVDEKTWQPNKLKVDDTRVASLAELLPPDFQVTSSLAKTLALYVERRKGMSPAFRERMAAELGVPLRIRFGLPADTSNDLLLCALFTREFLKVVDK